MVDNMEKMENMEKRIELEKRGRAPEEITELNLDNCRSTQIFGLTNEFKNLETLSLINVGLTTLKGFPSLPRLKKLELSDNRLSTGLNALQGCPSLTNLNLSGNKIKDLESLEPLKALAQLQSLDLFNCEVTNIEEYRPKVFEIVENLVYLDGFNKNDEEAEDEDEAEDGSDDELNGDEVGVDEDDEDDDDDDEDDEDEEEGEVGLSYLQKSGLEEDSEGEDFEPGDDDDEEDEDSLEEEDEENGDANNSAELVEGGRGVKRKRPVEDEKEDN